VGVRACWCGNADLAPFTPAYGECRRCGTLVYLAEGRPGQFTVDDDEHDYYGKQYWLQHQQVDLGLNDIHRRARADLSERALYWLDTLLKHRQPPARVMELGCAHGGFVALMRQAGFDAFGVEMSPWVVGFAQRTFGIPVRIGPVESLELAAASLDIIVLMDVLEHLPDPLGTMRRCLQLLAPDGMLLLQTPCFPQGQSLAQLAGARDRFLEMLIPDEHIYLFSRQSVTELFARLGAAHVQFEAALFPQYDMFLAVSRVPLAPRDPERALEPLAQEPARRLVLAMLDLHRALAHAQADRLARGAQIDRLTAMVQRSEAQRAALGREAQALAAQRRDTRWGLGPLRRWKRRLAPARRAPTDPAQRRIAVDVTPLLPGGENGGAKIFVLELLAALCKRAPLTRFLLLTHPRSHDELAALDGPMLERVLAPQAREPEPSTRRLPARALGFLERKARGAARRAGWWRLANWYGGQNAALLRELQADLLFCPFTAPTYWSPGIPTVCTVYDLQYRRYPQFFSAEDRAQRHRTFVRACLQADGLAAISDYSRDAAITEGKLDPARIRTIPLRLAQRFAPVSGSPDAGAPAQDAGARLAIQRLGLTPGRYFLYPANFWRHKNHEMLLTALGIARAEGLAPDIQLLCTGAPGARQQWLARAADSMGLGAIALFPGFLPEGELAAVMAGCLGVVFPSLFEGFGMPVIEAMAAGVPVACADTTSLPEVAAGAAILFDPRIPADIARALLALASDAPLRQRLIAAGHARAQEFADTGRMAQDYLALFDEAFARRRGRRRPAR